MTASILKKTLIFLLLISGFTISVFAQDEKMDKLGGLFKKATTILKSGTSGSKVSSDEITSGLKEALTIGAEKSTNKLSLTDGFFKNTAVKILLPQELQSIEKKMRFLGMGKLFDDAVLSLNRAAEDASKQAAPIFISAIKSMTVTDALQILKGSDSAATGYLRKTTQVELTNIFRPIIEESLKKVDATKYWDDVFTAYNQFSSKKVDTDINSYVTTKTLDGIFYYVAQEEMNIRKNPAERVSDILKKVFQ
ncbi:MAG: DUF4197 domain-containing protein [Ginsengibacter sp.]|jgi:hypothetical protein